MGNINIEASWGFSIAATQPSMPGTRQVPLYYAVPRPLCIIDDDVSNGCLPGAGQARFRGRDASG